MAENLDNNFGNFSIENTMDMGMGSAELLNDLIAPETSTGNPDDVKEIKDEPKQEAPKKETPKKEESTNEDTSQSIQDFLLGGEDDDEDENEDEPAAPAKKTPVAKEEQVSDNNDDEEDIELEEMSGEGKKKRGGKKRGGDGDGRKKRGGDGRRMIGGTSEFMTPAMTHVPATALNGQGRNANPLPIYSDDAKLWYR